MSDSLNPNSSQPETGEALHNPVLTRAHEPPRAGNHAWIMLGGLGVAVVAGVAFWAFASSHPAHPLENHAVAASAPSYTTAQNGG